MAKFKILVKEVEYMDQEMLEQIQQMPKAVLHIHLDGSLRPETVYKWLKEQGIDISLEEVRKQLMVDRNCRDLNQYLEKFSLPVSVLQSESHIEQAVYGLFEDLAKQNVIYAEVRFAPSLHTEKGLSYAQIVEAATAGMNKAKEQFAIQGNLILCCMRGPDNKKSNLQTVKVAKEYLGKGIVALDLAGAEALFPNKDYEDVFKVAKQLDIPFTMHAGEADGPQSIRKAIEMGATRIGHGVRCIEDKALMAELAYKEIPLEVCPISNLQTKAVEEPHPIDKIYKRGIRTTINTDNNTVSNTNILEEYQYVLENTDLTLKDIAQMNVNAIRGAYIPPQEKAGLIAEINKHQQNLENSHEEK